MAALSRFLDIIQKEGGGVSNEENLIKNSSLTPSERRERARKAGKASGAARRRRKKMKTVLSDLLTLPPDSKEAKAALKGLEGLVDEADNQTAVLAALMKRAMKGDTGAVKELRSILGEDVKAAPKTEKPTKTPDDGFIEAIGRKAGDDWAGQ